MRWVYLLQSLTNPTQRYKGSTRDLKVRLAQHNEGLVRSTARYRPWKVVVAIKFDNELRAEEFERYLKTGSGHAFSLRHFW